MLRPSLLLLSSLTCIRSDRQRRADYSNHTPDGVVKRECVLRMGNVSAAGQSPADRFPRGRQAEISRLTTRE